MSEPPDPGLSPRGVFVTLNRNQIIVLWVALSLLAPGLYLGAKALRRYNREIAEAKIGLIPDPFADQPREYRLRVERERFVDAFGIGIFEFLSISGMFFFLFRRTARDNLTKQG